MGNGFLGNELVGNEFVGNELPTLRTVMAQVHWNGYEATRRVGNLLPTSFTGYPVGNKLPTLRNSLRAPRLSVTRFACLDFIGFGVPVTGWDRCRVATSADHSLCTAGCSLLRQVIAAYAPLAYK